MSASTSPARTLKSGEIVQSLKRFRHDAASRRSRPAIGTRKF
jgi:hypothetical protein